MQLELVNPFVEASYDIVQEFLGEDIQQSDIMLMDKDSVIKGIAIRIAFKKYNDSYVLVNMEDLVAKGVVEKLMGEPPNNWDEMSISALGELGNMVSGRAVTKLESEEIDLDIDPPTVIFTDKEGVLSLAGEAMNVILETSLGKIQVIVYLNKVLT